MEVTKDFRAMYDYLQENRPDILDWCRKQARWHRCTLGAIFTWKEEAIKHIMEKEERK